MQKKSNLENEASDATTLTRITEYNTDKTNFVEKIENFDIWFFAC